jgi:tRNA (guanine-N7-)-methyltransferase
MAHPLSRSLEEHLVPWEACAWPPDWSELFARRAPLALEVGFGNGEFLAAEAERRPERDHVGIELSWVSATRLFPRLARQRLDNVRVVLGDAELLVELLFPPGSLVECFINHPCPWPKDRHAERRLVRARFLSLIAERLAPGGKLSIATDHPALALEIGARLAEEPALASCHPSAEVTWPADRSTTKYQRKAEGQGLPIHFFEWRRVGQPAPVPPALVPVPPDSPMPHLNLVGTYPAERLFDGFAPALHHETADGVEVVVRFQNVFAELGRGSAWLLETLVQEGRLRQEFAIVVARRAQGGLHVRLSALGNPRPTHGVRRAVELVGRWLLQRSPGLELAYENLGDLTRPAREREA